MKSFSEKKCNQRITFILNQFNIQYLKTDLKTVFLDHENLRIVVLNTYYIDEVLFNKSVLIYSNAHQQYFKTKCKQYQFLPA